MKRPTMWTAPALCAFAILSSGCFATRAIPDPNIPHRISRDVDVWEWRRLPDGSMTENFTRYPAGCWIAFPHLVEKPAPTIQPKDRK